MKRILKIIISLLIYILDGTFGKLKGVNIFGGRPQEVVLYYHKVTEPQLDNFEKQIKYLTDTDSISVIKRTSDDGKIRISVTFDDAFSLTLKRVIPILNKYSVFCEIFVPTDYFGKTAGWIDDVENMENAVISKEEMTGLKNDLIQFGSHCQSHVALEKLGDEEARKEINESKRIMEKVLGHGIKSISFPHGSYSTINLRDAQNAGYETIFTIDGYSKKRLENSDVIGRIRVDPSDYGIEFKLKCHGAYRWIWYLRELGI